jgi:uncharacterized protein
VTRRRLLGLASGATAFTFWHRKAHSFPAAEARMMRTDPARYAVLIGNLLDGFGADHILWGTDTPVIGPPHWQIEAFQTLAIPEELAAQHGYLRRTPEVKNKIFGENAARIFGINVAAARQAIEGDLLYKLRDDRNPPPAGAAPL